LPAVRSVPLHATCFAELYRRPTECRAMRRPFRPWLPSGAAFYDPHSWPSVHAIPKRQPISLNTRWLWPRPGKARRATGVTLQCVILDKQFCL